MTDALLAALTTFRETGNAGPLLAQIPYTGFVGLEVTVQGGSVVSVLRARDTNIGNTQIPAVHGGVVGALMEHAAIMELFHKVDAAHPPKTINISIDYLRPCLGGRDTFAVANVVKQGRRIANVRVQAYQDGPDRPVAAAHAHFLLR